jgi:hypothetical protein
MSQASFQGRIARVSSKPFQDNRTGENITLHSFQLEGKSQWFRTGTKPIPAGNGQDVKFVATGANVDMASFQVVAAAAPSVAPAVTAQTYVPPSAPRQSTSTGSKDGYWENKEKRDLEKEARFQAVNEPRMALSVATEAAALLVSTAITKDAISFGSAAKAKKLGLLASYTKEVALELAAFINDAPNQLKNFKDSGGAPVDQDAAEQPGVQE